MPRTIVVSVALILAGCGGLATLGPTPPGEGIVMYLHASFAGPSQALNVDVEDLEKVEGPCSRGEEGEQPTWSDCISSVRVLPGWSATLYRDRAFKGRSVTLSGDAPDLRAFPGPCDDDSFNDCVSSIRVSRLSP